MISTFETRLQVTSQLESELTQSIQIISRLRRKTWVQSNQWRTIALALGKDRRAWIAKARTSFQPKVGSSLIEPDPFDTNVGVYPLTDGGGKNKPGTPCAVIEINTV